MTIAKLTIAGALLLAPAAALAAGDAAAGKTVFAKCAICHSVVTGQNKIGPSLAGVVGRKSGSLAGFNYSAPMKAANLTWDAATLDKYLANPKAVVPGTKMIFAGLAAPADRANVIAFLSQNTGAAAAAK